MEASNGASLALMKCALRNSSTTPIVVKKRWTERVDRIDRAIRRASRKLKTKLIGLIAWQLKPPLQIAPVSIRGREISHWLLDENLRWMKSRQSKNNFSDLRLALGRERAVLEHAVVNIVLGFEVRDSQNHHFGSASFCGANGRAQ